jgi:dihydrofolate synthase / folylpolyglutamate synthase
MNYAEAVRFLYSLGNEVKAAKLGLDRIEILLDALGRPDRSGEFIHVAGTNGKGSTCAMIEAVLRASGVRTGLYTSPHLAEPTERIRIAGRPVSPEQFAGAFDHVHEAAERLMAGGALDAHPTYFETVTAMAFLLFRELQAKVTVLEVGLGGRLDATNVVHPRIAVVTPVDFDHEALLGRSLESIATEKAGILKPGVPAVFARQRPDVASTLARRAAELGIEPLETSRWQVSERAVYPNGSSFRAADPSGREIRIECPLAGEHQVENALTALTVLDALGFPADEIQRGLALTVWPGRLERVSAAPEIVLDGAHNPAGARSLAAHIRRFYQGRRVWLVYGAMRDKAVEEMAGILFPLADELILTAPAQARAVRPESIGELAGHSRARVAPTIREALEIVRREVPPADAVFVTGSLFLVAEARRELLPRTD